MSGEIVEVSSDIVFPSKVKQAHFYLCLRESTKNRTVMIADEFKVSYAEYLPSDHVIGTVVDSALILGQAIHLDDAYTEEVC